MTYLLDIKDHVMIAASGLAGHMGNFPRLLDLTEGDRKALDVWLIGAYQYCDKVMEAINVANRTNGKHRS